METDVSGAISFSDIDLDAPQSNYAEYLDHICPYYMMMGMTWDEFWYESIERFATYWQMHQFNIERRNQELWMQGIYFVDAIMASLGIGKKTKYPSKPYRITEMTDAEREEENRRKVEQLREILNAHKTQWDARHKGS